MRMKRWVLLIAALCLMTLPGAALAEGNAPTTNKPYVAEHDMASLSGTLPQGVEAKAWGFDWGESADALSHRVKGNKPYEGEFTKLITGLTKGTTYYYRAYAVTAQGESYGQVLSFATLEQDTWSDEDAIFATAEERYRFLFDDDSRCPTFENPPKGYYGAGEVGEHLTKVTVPIWRKTGSNGRASSTWTFTINRKLAANAQAIFQEIYELDIQFPINKIYTYQYRKINGPSYFSKTSILSHHSFGTAIDINHDQNLFYSVGHDGRNKSDPYTINQQVIDVFERHGWSWGGYYKEGIDAMHFQYLGLDLLEKVDYVSPPCEDIRG